MKYFIILIFLSGFSYKLCQSQNREIDSLKLLLNQSEEDTSRVSILASLAYAYREFSPDTVLMFANQSMDLSKKLNYQRGIAKSYNTLGLASWMQNNYHRAIDYYKLSMSIMKNLNDSLGLSTCLSSLGGLYTELGDYSRGLSHLTKSLDIVKKINAKSKFALKLYNIGIIYQEIGDYTGATKVYIESIEKGLEQEQYWRVSKGYHQLATLEMELDQPHQALNYLNKSIKINNKYNYKSNLASNYLLLGNIFIKKDSLDKGYDLFLKALKTYNKMKNSKGIGYVHYEIGLLHMAKNEPELATVFFKEAIKIMLSIGEVKGAAQVYNYLSCAYSIQNKLTLSIKYAFKGLNLAKELGIKKEVTDASELLYKAYLKENNTEQALKYLLVHKNYSDSLLDEVQVKEIAKANAKHHKTVMTIENKLLRKDNELKKIELKRNQAQLNEQKYIAILSSVALIIALLVAYLIYRLYEFKTKANVELIGLNYEIIQQKDEIETQSESLSQAYQKIKDFNDTLESKINERTKELQIQNRKIKRYAFSNAHEVRAPLARLLGLVHILNIEPISTQEYPKMVKMITEASEELDDIIRKVSKLLSEDNEQQQSKI